MDRFDFYLSQYHSEIEARHNILREINVPILIISAIGSLNFYFFDNYSWDLIKASHGIFIIGIVASLIISSLAILTSIWYLIRFYTEAHTQFTIPTLEEIEGLYRETVQDLGDPELAVNLLEEEIMRLLVISTDHNKNNNLIKSYYLYIAKVAVVIGLVFALVHLMLCVGEMV